MEKIVLVSGTNRPNSNTLKVSRIYNQVLESKNVQVEFLDLRVLPETIAFSESFGKRTEEYSILVNRFVSSASKFIFIVPEYNGSFPGILKTFIDSIHPREWAFKKACLVGVSDGRAGNLRGMDHLTGVLQYLKMDVFYNKLPISVINKVMDSENRFTDDQLKVCINQVEGFLKY